MNQLDAIQEYIEKSTETLNKAAKVLNDANAMIQNLSPKANAFDRLVMRMKVHGWHNDEDKGIYHPSDPALIYDSWEDVIKACIDIAND